MIVGASAATSLTTGSDNVLVGLQSGSAITTGSNNTFIGSQAGTSVDVGSYNILIGAGVNAPNASNSNQLNIGNVIGGNLSAGSVGINTMSPQATLDVNGHVANSATGVPSISCGAGVLTGNDTRGYLSASPTTGCTITFYTAYVTTPFCVATSASNGKTVTITSVSTTSLIVTPSGSGTAFYYMCMQ